MPPDLPKTTVKLITALLKHQAKLWLGEETVGIAAETFIDEDLQKRLDDWLSSEETARKLLKASEQAQLYLQDQNNCPDADLRHLFRDLSFGDLSSVQAALTELPQAMDSSGVQQALLDSFRRDVPNLSPEQQIEAARIYTDALLRAIGSLEQFVSPILLQTALDLKKGQHTQDKKLDAIIAHLESRTQARPVLPVTQPGDLPPGSYLPFPRNGFFTGRAADLETLAKDLLGEHGPGVVVNQAVTGMGGLGKTQLAVEFAYQYGHRFQGVHWLDLRDAQTLDTQIALCGMKMGLSPLPPTLEEQVTATLREWLQNGPRLLILDNFEEIEAANDVFARLRHSDLRLLVTSRHADWNPALGLRRLPLDEFNAQESLEFLRNYISPQRESDEELEKLAVHLGRLPLALELAGRYLEKQPRLTVREYLVQLEKALDHKSMQNWKAERKSLTGHDLSLLQTFAQSWEQVTDVTTQKLFITLGVCAPNTPIPGSILEIALAEQTDMLDECLDDLLALGLLKAGPSIHPLLAQFARRLDPEQGYLKPFCEAFAELANQTNDEEDRTGNYALYSSILPHVRAAAGYAEYAALGPAGSLWNNLGYHIQTLADYAGAKAAFERALKIDEATYGPDHPDVAIDVNNLGNVLRELGDHAGAKAAFERALKIDEATYGPDHPDVAIDVNNLGMVLQDLGDHAGAKAAFERALKIDEATYGPDHPKVAIRVNNLGLVLKDLGDHAGAKAAYERAIKIWETSLGSEHPQVAKGVNNLGIVLKALGDHVGAKAAYERAIKIWETSLGSEHPQVATGVNNLGSVLRDLGDPAGAKAAFERALKIDEATYGPDHPNVAIRVNNLGNVLQALGDYAGAKAAYERAIKILETSLGSEHPQVATGVNNLGNVLQALGDPAGAKAAFERALKIEEATYGPDHPDVAIYVNNLGGVLKDLGDHAGAKTAFERALKIFEKFLPADHPNIKIVKGNLESL
jgi:tetratricopeptide (TPR) repeat protein